MIIKKKFCKKCGNELTFYESNEEKTTREKKEKRNKKIEYLLRYGFGILITYGSIKDLIDLCWYGILGIIFGLSLLPITYKIISKYTKDNINIFFKKNIKLLQIIIPIIFGLLWGISNPGEKLQYITINDSGQTIAINEKYNIDFSTNLSKKNLKRLKFISSDNSIAEVKNGKIIGKKEGKVKITIKGERKISETAEYIVKFVELDSIKLYGEQKLMIGEDSKIKYELSPKNASNKITKWSSSDTKIIDIDKKGDVIAKSVGTATITAKSDNNKTQQFEITVYNPIEEIRFKSNIIKLENGTSLDIPISVYPTEDNLSFIKYEIDDDTIAKVENGILYATNEGITTLTAKSRNGITKSINVEVYEQKAESISLNKSNISLLKGQSETIYATISPSNVTDKSIKWKSSNSSVATVTDGSITAKGIGETTITATTNNSVSASIIVTVKEKAPIKINSFRYNIDTACGVEWNFSITNNSNKDINYITMEWYNYNGVGDFVYDEITWENKTSLRYSGPLKAGSNTGSIRNTTKFYNCSYKSSIFSSFEIQYSDYSTQKISNSDFKYYENLN